LAKFDMTDGLQLRVSNYLNVFVVTQVWLKLFLFAQI